MITFIINSLLNSNYSFNMCRLPEVVVKVLMSCPALSFLPLGHHFDDLALKSPTRIEHVGCCLLIPESTSMRFSQKDSHCSWHLRKHLPLFTFISVTIHSFNLQMPVPLVSGKNSILHKQTPPLFVLLG